jgi:hypothetical protein
MPAHAPPPIVPHGGWVPYGSRDAVALAIVLVVLAVAFGYVGTWLRSPFGIRRPGRTVRCIMIAIWGLALSTFLVAAYAYGVQLRQVQLGVIPLTGRLGTVGPPAVHVGTLPDAAVTFFVILYLTRGYGWKIALGSAVVGTAAAPMIFELPFDLIIMGRTVAIPPNPTLYRALFFFPLFIVELSTLSLLTMLPSMRITRHSCYALAGMFAVFALWATFGFGPPTAPLPRTLNVISKVLCFVTAIMLFVGRETLQKAGHVDEHGPSEQ